MIDLKHKLEVFASAGRDCNLGLLPRMIYSKLLGSPGVEEGRISNLASL